MIAAATQFPAHSKMLFNWFDVALIGVVAIGFWRGRANGMSKEFLPLVQWLITVIGGAFGYQPLGDELIRLGVIRDVFGKTFTEQTAAYFTAYLVIAVAILVVFSTFKRKAKAKLEGSQAFGGGEYYLGIVSGVLRYFCMVLFALALLNAPVYTLADAIQAKQFNNRWFGGGMQGYSGDFFPTPSEVQTSVFKDSLSGPFLKDNLAVLLINTIPPGHEIKPLGQGQTEIIMQHPR
jgi:uncharacterized membrane protein required for colicin V production